MNPSDFEKLVLSAIIEGDPEQVTLAQQLAFATVAERDYTGVGLYTKLLVDLKVPRLAHSSRYIEKIPKVHLTHPGLPDGAGALLWITDGRADTLECYTYNGEWPSDESQFSVLKYS